MLREKVVTRGLSDHPAEDVITGAWGIQSLGHGGYGHWGHGGYGDWGHGPACIVPGCAQPVPVVPVNCLPAMLLAAACWDHGPSLFSTRPPLASQNSTTGVS